MTEPKSNIDYPHMVNSQLKDIKELEKKLHKAINVIEIFVENISPQARRHVCPELMEFLKEVKNDK